MAEIPLVYPNHVHQPRRYVVDGHTQTLFREELPSSPRVDGDNDYQDDPHPILEASLPGSASVSELELKRRSVLLTTCPKMEDASILCVSLSSSSSTADWTSPIMLDLDYSQLELQPLVAVEAFSEEGIWIRLNLVDIQGTFATVFLTDQLTPVTDGPLSKVQVFKAMDYIADHNALVAVTGSELQPNMVAFANSTTAIIALSPFVFTVDLATAKSHRWSETACLERAKTAIGGIFNTGMDILFGKLDDNVMDMSPTAALCLSTTSNPLLDATYCVTLHSDASIRRWRMDTNGRPMEVLSLDHKEFPPSSDWSGAHNSVALCARVFKHAYFAVAVQIKTEGGGLLTMGDGDNEEPSSRPSDCQLWVFYGSTQDTGEKPTCTRMTVPNQAVSLVGMNFSPTSARCTLSALFESTDQEHDRASTIHVTYPPCNSSMIASRPEIVGHGSLDKVASKERSRIRSLLLGPSLLDSMEESTVEEILHEMDSWYLKYLFRPMFPRGTGTVLPPSAPCIRRALAKLVHGSSSSKNKKVGMSIELELIRTMYEWRQREIRKALVARTPTRKSNRISPRSEMSPPAAEPATPFSVYESFVQKDDGDDDDEMEVEGATDEDWEKVEQERSTEVEAHEKRWRRILLQIWEEEQVNRMPLMVKWLSSQPLQVMVRSGLTTVTEDVPQRQEMIGADWGKTLDGFALKLLSRIEQDKERSSRLYAVEQQVSTIVAKAELALQPLGNKINEELTALARWALGDETDGLSDEDHERLEETVSGLTPSQLVNWIQATPTNSSGALPGLEIIGGNESPDNKGVTWSHRQVANYQLRHSACALALRCIDSVRRLQLSRSLLLLDMVEGSQARDAALRAYLHAIGILWTSSQRVPMPLTAFHARKPVRLDDSSPETASPPNKRLSFGDDATSILAPLTSMMTTSIDVAVVEISQTMGSNSILPQTPVGVPIFLTRSYFRLAFPARNDIPIGKPSLLPELGALPPPKDDSIATDFPRLALRLLSPYVAYALPEDSADVVLTRKESLAECLLIESHATSVVGRTRAKMREIACELLVPKSPGHDSTPDQRMIRTAFEVLRAIKQNSPVAPVAKEALANTLQQMIPTGTSIEIHRLCDLETVKSLFSPMAVGGNIQLNSDTRSCISLLASVMLHLSRVMYRLTILERHVSARGSNEEGESPNVLLGFISGAINDMGKTFPDDVCQVMPEYGKMWARLFNHAVHAGQWKTAYSACVRNPKSEHRESSFRRMVRSMVDQGALNELLLLCTELGQRISSVSSLSPTETGEAVDLYEIASEILADAVSKDLYSVRASSPEPTSLSDFQGALYALHASQKHWRRAAQSMDLRFINAQRALGTKNRGYELNLQSVELRDGLIVEDLALASAAALVAIDLVKDRGHKFLVSGEYGPYNKIPVGDSDDAGRSSVASSKRTRGPVAALSEEKSSEGGDRLSQFMTRVELEGRAIRSIALKALFFDRSADPAFAKEAFLRHIASSKLDIDFLFKNGYFQYGLLLAKAWAKNREADTGSSRPEGSDLFYDSLCHMLEMYLIPKALEGSSEVPRPTLEQLHLALDSVGAPEEASYVVPERCCKLSQIQAEAVKMAAMSLVRKLTLAHTTAETPIAVDVATMFLENDATVLPTWLERFVMGADTASSTGLFALRPRPGAYTYLGDPMALLTLYTKQGLFVEACAVVSSALSVVGADGKARETNAASRLPEKGDIDFLPYKAIDVLWNVIDIVLSKKVLGASEEKEVRAARDGVETALAKHFALANISEAGLRSARVLQS